MVVLTFRRSVATPLSALLVAAAALVLAVPASAGNAEDEGALYALTNEARAAAGLDRLADDPAAANVARGWANQLAGSGTLAHNPNLAAEVGAYVTSEWRRVGENVGFGGTAGQVHDAFMNSAGHRANVLGDYNRVGVGAVRDGNGRLWVALVFVKGPAIAAPAPFVPNVQPPIGSLDSAVPTGRGLRVAGWALDPDTAAPIDVHVYVDGSAVAARADLGRYDVAGAFPGYGAGHGYDLTVGLAPGVHQVCTYGINDNPAGANSSLGCTWVSSLPFGSVDAVVPTLAGMRVVGWAIDPDSTGAAVVHTYVADYGVPVVADSPRPDVAAAYPGYGAAHGFDVIVPTWGGTCAFGIDNAGAGNPALGCA